MEVAQQSKKIADLVRFFNNGSLLSNREYQRGEAWKHSQKAAFVDSVFRRYPVPALFLHRREDDGYDGRSTKLEIVDGQQRLTALRDFVNGEFGCEPVLGKTRLRLPESVRRMHAPWAGLHYSSLSTELRSQYDSTEVLVFEIDDQAHPDEVRDLFIRLQSGTALTRQQVRDAWPGNLGPYIERLAGKITRRPTAKLFGIIDKRGQGSADDDSRDAYVGDRQFCAQLLTIFLSRERDPFDYPSVSASNVDSLYHEHTDFEDGGEVARRFVAALDATAEVFEIVKKLSSMKKFRRLDVTSVMMYLQDVTKSDSASMNTRSIRLLSKAVAEAINDKERPAGRSTTGVHLKNYYLWWRERIGDGVIRLDTRRVFDAKQKSEISDRQSGNCAVCGLVVADEDAEYDHFPIPHRDGGLTEVSNGRLVHATCHERGRPAILIE